MKTKRNKTTTTVVIIHGITGHAGIHWQQWVHDQLVAKDFTVIMPDMPEADHPDRFAWLQTIQQLISAVKSEELVFVGHSLGVATALDVIEHLDGKAKGLVSVAGFGHPYGAALNDYFMREREIQFDRVKEHLGMAFVLYGDDDPYVPQETLKALASALNVSPKIYPRGGHLNTNAGFTEFQDVITAVERLV